eukprot:7380199-Prymnesium_polylepis.1
MAATPHSTAPPSESSTFYDDEHLMAPSAAELRYHRHDFPLPAPGADGEQLSDNELGPILHSPAKLRCSFDALSEAQFVSATGGGQRKHDKMARAIERLERGLERLETLESALEESMRPVPDWDELAYDVDRFKELAARGSTSRRAVVAYIVTTALLILGFILGTQAIAILAWPATVSPNDLDGSSAAIVLDTLRPERPWYPGHEPSPTGWLTDVGFLRLVTFIVWATVCTTGLGME